jgi:hypothetical protein
MERMNMAKSALSVTSVRNGICAHSQVLCLDKDCNGADGMLKQHYLLERSLDPS